MGQCYLIVLLVPLLLSYARSQSGSGQDCLPNQWQCDDGNCIPTIWWCDGLADCLDDSDEQCPGGSGSECSINQWKCGPYGQCIPSSWKCDAYLDCLDGSDELNCTSCQPYSSLCNSGECITDYAWCDGLSNCIDGSDELDCEGCFSYELDCGDGQCIPFWWMCDGFDDCLDGSDEVNCSQGCGEDGWQCDSGQCIQDGYLCDGYEDCRDFSDERNCRAGGSCAGFSTCCSNDDINNCTGNSSTCFCDGLCYKYRDCCSDIAASCDAPAHHPVSVNYLRFLSLGSTDGVNTTIMEAVDDGKSSAIHIRGSFPFSTTQRNIVYVYTNGYVSFESPGSFLNGDYVIPYGSDIDISRGVGGIRYEVHTVVSASSFLADVSAFIRSETGSAFTGRWMLLVEWRNVPHYKSPTHHLTNTFQAVVITSGDESYALFTYECGSMEWSGGASIGIDDNNMHHDIHRLSGTYRENEVACLNIPETVWSNLLYQISDGIVPIPSGSCAMVGYRSCCNDDSKCSGVPETCHCDELCYTLDDCCGDIEEICDSSVMLFQLQFTGIDNCSSWTSNNTGSKLLDIREYLQEKIDKLCDCGFTIQHITSGEFQCLNETTYRARVRSTSDTNSSQIMAYIQEWVVSGEASLQIQGKTFSVECQSVQIGSFDDPGCEHEAVSEEPTSSDTSPDDTVVIITGVAAVGVLIAILTVLIVIVIVAARFLKRRQSQVYIQRKEGRDQLVQWSELAESGDPDIKMSSCAAYASSYRASTHTTSAGSNDYNIPNTFRSDSNGGGPSGDDGVYEVIPGEAQ